MLTTVAHLRTLSPRHNHKFHEGEIHETLLVAKATHEQTYKRTNRQTDRQTYGQWTPPLRQASLRCMGLNK